MTIKTKIIISAVALLSAFAVGRWAAPEKIKIETKTVEVEKKTDKVQTDADRNRRTETTETKVTRPDGTVEETKKTVTEAQTHTDTDRTDSDQTSKVSTEDKEITRPSAKVTVAALAGVKFSTSLNSPVLYGASISKPILGPIAVSLWGLSDLSFGAGIGLNF